LVCRDHPKFDDEVELLSGTSHYRFLINVESVSKRKFS